MAWKQLTNNDAGQTKGFINLDLVERILPNDGGSIIIFMSRSHWAVLESPLEILQTNPTIPVT